jgi:hypothetical protein
MELHAQAFRQARSEGLEGAALDQRVAAMVADPPPNIRLAAADAALYNTFSNPNGAFGQTLAFAADLTNALNSGDVDPDHVAQWDEVTAGGIAGLAQFAGNKTYLQDLADLAQAMADPQRHGGADLDRLAGSLLSTGGEEPAVLPLAAMAAQIMKDPRFKAFARTVRRMQAPQQALPAR